MYIQEGTSVTAVDLAGNRETFDFPSVEEAKARIAIAEEAHSWIRTPYRNCADVKGLNGGVDCAMLLVRCYVDTGRLPPFDPRPYSPQWFLHRDEEKFLEWIETKLHGVRVEKPSLGDVTVYKFGRCFAHGSIYIGVNRVIHSAAKCRCCVMSEINDVDLLRCQNGGLRDIRFYTVTHG